MSRPNQSEPLTRSVFAGIPRNQLSEDIFTQLSNGLPVTYKAPGV